MGGVGWERLGKHWRGREERINLQHFLLSIYKQEKMPESSTTFNKPNIQES